MAHVDVGDPLVNVSAKRHPLLHYCIQLPLIAYFWLHLSGFTRATVRAIIWRNKYWVESAWIWQAGTDCSSTAGAFVILTSYQLQPNTNRIPCWKQLELCPKLGLSRLTGVGTCTKRFCSCSKPATKLWGVFLEAGQSWNSWVHKRDASLLSGNKALAPWCTMPVKILDSRWEGKWIWWICNLLGWFKNVSPPDPWTNILVGKTALISPSNRDSCF